MNTTNYEFQDDESGEIFQPLSVASSAKGNDATEAQGVMLTLSCKSFRVRHDVETVILEIDGAAPANLVPQLLTKTDVAKRLAISERKVEAIAASGRLPIVRLDSCVRFREADILHLLSENQESVQKPIVSEIPLRSKMTRR